MKVITLYETGDGRRFETKARAEAHEFVLDKVQHLPSTHTGDVRPDPNGADFVQHPQGTRAALDRIYTARGVHPRADDDGGSPWYDVWTRLMCIDAFEREWGQQFFAGQPNAAATVKVTR